MKKDSKRSIKSYLFFPFCLIMFMAGSFAHSVTPTLFGNLGLGDYMFGVVLAAMLTVNFIVSPFWGKLNSTVPGKVSLIIGCIGYALGQLFFSLSRTELHFFLARSFTGIFTSACSVGVLTYALNLSDDPQKRGTNLTIVATLQMVGNSFGFLVGGLLGEISIWTALGAQIATLTTCGIAFGFICKKDRELSVTRSGLVKIIREANPLSALMDGRKFMTPALTVLFVIVMLQNLGIIAYDQSSNYYLRDVFNFTSGYNGVIKGITGMLTLFINVAVTTRLVKRFKIKPIISGLLISCCVFMSGVVFIQNQMSFIVFNTLFYAAGAAILPLLQRSLTGQAAEEHNSLVMGFYTSMTALGNIIGALASGLLYAVSPGMPFVFGLCAYVLALVLALARL